MCIVNVYIDKIDFEFKRDSEIGISIYSREIPLQDLIPTLIGTISDVRTYVCISTLNVVCQSRD